MFNIIFLRNFYNKLKLNLMNFNRFEKVFRKLFHIFNIISEKIDKNFSHGTNSVIYITVIRLYTLL